MSLSVQTYWCDTHGQITETDTNAHGEHVCLRCRQRVDAQTAYRL